MESWGAYGVFAARYAGDRAPAGACQRGQRIRGAVLLAAFIAVGALLDPLATGNNVTRDSVSQPGSDTPAAVFDVGPGEPFRIPAMDEKSASSSGGADQPLDRHLSGEPSGDDGLLVDVRRVLEQLASES